MILKITRESVHNNKVIKTFDPIIIDVNQLDLDLMVILKLKQMCAINNAHYELVGSDTKCRYNITPVNCHNAFAFKSYANKYIKDGTDKYNELVDARNADIKVVNKRNSRPLETGLLKVLSEVDTKGISILATEEGNLYVR